VIYSLALQTKITCYATYETRNTCVYKYIHCSSGLKICGFVPREVTHSDNLSRCSRQIRSLPQITGQTNLGPTTRQRGVPLIISDITATSQSILPQYSTTSENKQILLNCPLAPTRPAQHRLRTPSLRHWIRCNTSRQRNSDFDNDTTQVTHNSLHIYNTKHILRSAIIARYVR